MLRRFQYVDWIGLMLWVLRAVIILLVIWGTIATIIDNPYTIPRNEAAANADLMAAAPELLKSLCNLLEWAKGNKGSKHSNPYCVPEVKSALEHLAKLQGIKDYLDAKTK